MRGSCMLQIDSEPVGKGFEREAFVHPEDANKIIKISMELPYVNYFFHLIRI